MSATFADIEQEARQLPAHDRAQLAELLLETLPGSEWSEFKEEWRKEWRLTNGEKLQPIPPKRFLPNWQDITGVISCPGAEALGFPLRGTVGLVLAAKQAGQLAAARPVLEQLWDTREPCDRMDTSFS